MRYYEAELLKNELVGQDELGNDIYDLVPITVSNVRLTEWTSEDIEVYGRQMTEGNRKVLVRPFGESLEDIEHIRIDGQTYEIKSIKDVHRWILLIVGGYRI